MVSDEAGLSVRFLGLINARGGSRGIPRKNVKELAGKPLIAWTIEAARDSRRLDRLVVSTEDQEIAEVAGRFGADVPFMRPPELASDTALQIDAIRHALQTLGDAGDAYDGVTVLQPTCPLRRTEDIDGALDLFQAATADTVISVTAVQGQHPLTMYTRSDDGTLSALFESDGAGVLRQEFPVTWWRNGAIYVVRTSLVLERRSLYGPRLFGYPMPPERSANIDEPLDWVIAEAMIERLGEKTD